MDIRLRPIFRRLQQRNPTFAPMDGPPSRSGHILVDMDPEANANDADPNLVMNHEDVRAWRENGQRRDQDMTWKEWTIFGILVLLNMYIGYKLIMSTHHSERQRLRTRGATITQVVIPDGSSWNRRGQDDL